MHSLSANEEDTLYERIAGCIIRGKIAHSSPHPPDMRDQDGTDELVRYALERGAAAQTILEKGLMAGMKVVGERFRARQYFVPDVLMAAKAMHAGMNHLRPHFEMSGVRHRGTFVIGTVRGDLHDIGKKLVSMMVTGAGWDVVDLGVDVPPDIFLDAIGKHNRCVVGMSALLTTTMGSMKETVIAVKSALPRTPIIVGGAPVTDAFAKEIGADAYGSDPASAVEFLEHIRQAVHQL